MKILFLTENYYPNTSGVPVVVAYLAEGLAGKGYEVEIATRSVDNYPREDVINGISVYRFDIWKRTLKTYAGEIEHYRNFVTNSDADIVIFECSECVTTDVLLNDLNRIRGKKIFHSHGFNGLCLKPFKRSVNLKYTLGNTYNWLRFKWYYGHTFKKAIKEFDKTLCLSDVDSSKIWLEHNAKSVTVLQNAVDDMFCFPTQLVPLKEVREINKPYYVCVAGFSKVKNQVGIIREFFKTQTDAALVLIGPKETEYYHHIKKEIKRQKKLYGDRDVLVFTGIPRKMIPDIVGNASLYLCGSFKEEYSISLIEAQCKGIPFISTNVGNARIMPGGITLSKISDMHIEIDRIMRDHEFYKKTSKKGKQFVHENCRREKAVDQIDYIIKSLIG